MPAALRIATRYLRVGRRRTSLRRAWPAGTQATWTFHTFGKKVVVKHLHGTSLASVAIAGLSRYAWLGARSKPAPLSARLRVGPVATSASGARGLLSVLRKSWFFLAARIWRSGLLLPAARCSPSLCCASHCAGSA